MVQRRSSLGLALEAAESLLIFGNFIGQELERDKAAEFHILGLIYDTHAATAEFVDDAVMRNGLADHAGRIISSGRHLRGRTAASQCVEGKPATTFPAESANAAYTKDLDLEDTLTARCAFAIEKFSERRVTCRS